MLYLDVKKNALTEDGKDAMYQQAIFGTSPSERSKLNTVFEANLNSVSGANHTCGIVGICAQRKTFFMNYNNQSAKRNRRKKLFYLLENRHRTGRMISLLESEFSKDSMTLVPHVLACINTYSAKNSEQRCLSILFELARNWKTPEIYQLHQA